MYGVMPVSEEQMGGCRKYSEPIPFVLPNVLPGMIILWSGAVSNIPSGFALCDGNNGTPDLRNRFIKGAENDGAVGNTGGAVNHNHDFTGNGHQHTLGAGLNLQAGSNLSNVSSSDPAIGTTDNQDGQPPWYKLAYIMKL